MTKETAKNTKQPAAASASKDNKKGTEKKAEQPASAATKPTENAGATKPQEVKQSYSTSSVQLPTAGEIVPPESISFPKLEEAILAHWQRIRAFETSVKFSEGRPRYTFYDGPPFATGLPHYGHLLAGSIKDVMCRWAHQSGFYVERRFGWDCHGLPVEYEIDKKLGIKGPDDVLKMGITKYNAECRAIVSRYSNEWEAVVSRMGRWIDFRNDYKTMYPWFMESVWWVFKELYRRGLVYRGVKVMPFSTACSTPLSNFESGQNYKDVTDPAVFVGFPLEDEPNVSLVAWTTTPWTLPSNLALCVNPDMKYVKVRDAKTGSIYILMEARLEGLYKRHPQPANADKGDAKNKAKADDAEYAILDRFDGKTLVGRRYAPLFKYFEDMRTRTGAFRVVADGYVTSESGTGIVHQAPYFGEDDFRVCLRERIISKEMKPICPVDDAGRFTSEVTDFVGLHVKEADKSIMDKIKEMNRLVHRGTTTHSYPFCWRSDTPLIYKAVPSWFVRVEAHSSDLLAALESTYWVPDFVKSKRFANWLTEARDWAISRSRFWGTPIPLWASEDFEEIVCVGSIEELARLTGVRVTDLHRENIDHLTIKSARPGMPDLRRVPEVFDCWFESGSMPYAQMHFPFENQRQFLEEQFPADFIAEGIDQTRGWFYTLLVISTLLFGKAPFKNLIVNGIVLASDGQKMSKRLKNYPDPSDIIGRFGADALRLYLVNSPAVRADNLRFKEEGVNDIIKQFFLPFYHSYRYLLQSVARYQKEHSTEFTFDESRLVQPTNFMDKWILSVIQSLLKFVKAEMREYRLYTVLAKLVRFIDDLTNWYVKMNRKRLKGDASNAQDNYEALQTLFAVQLTIVKLLAPFTPFLTEFIYLGLKRFLVGVAYRNPTELDAKNVSDKDSVHFLPLPEIRQDFIDEKIELTVSAMQTVVDLGRVIRERKTLPLKLPLREAVVICTDEEKLARVREMEKYIKAELNIKRLHTTSRASDYHCTFKFDMDFKRLGQRFRKDRERVEQLVKAMNADQVRQFNESGTILLDGRFELTSEDLRVSYTFESNASQQQSGAAQDDTPQYEADSRGDLLVLVDCYTNAALLDEFAARKFLNIVQKLRKRHALQPTDAILVGLQSAAELQRIVTQTHAELVNATLKQPLMVLADSQSEAAKRGWKLIGEETLDLQQDRIRVCLFGDSSLLRSTTTAAPEKTSNDAPVVVRGTPSCTFRNLVVKLRDGRSLHCTRLCENPRGLAAPPLETSALLQELRLCNAQCTVAPDNEQKTPFCRFVNVSLVDASGAEKKTGTVLLENPRGTPSFTTTAEVRHFVHRLFAISAKRFSEVQLFEKDTKGQLVALQLTDGVQLVEALNGRTLVCKA